jgi:hypothetical protein
VEAGTVVEVAGTVAGTVAGKVEDIGRTNFV